MSKHSVTVDNNTVIIQFQGSVREANKLRRIFLDSIPTMAIDTVNIRKNESTQVDEFIARRLELIPLLLDATEYKDSERIELHLEKTGGSVLSQHITGCEVMDDIIVTKLREDDTLIVDMVARKGTSSIDAKWKPVSNVEFRPIKDGLVEIKATSVGIYSPKKLAKIALKIYENN